MSLNRTIRGSTSRSKTGQFPPFPLSLPLQATEPNRPKQALSQNGPGAKDLVHVPQLAERHHRAKSGPSPGSHFRTPLQAT